MLGDTDALDRTGFEKPLATQITRLNFKGGVCCWLKRKDKELAGNTEIVLEQSLPLTLYSWLGLWE